MIGNLVLELGSMVGKLGGVKSKYNKGEDRNVKEECGGKGKKRDNPIYICGLAFPSSYVT
jgi:hypothetical protein